jgi:acetyltransferase-like isoleucine patch superfamily enzyme
VIVHMLKATARGVAALLIAPAVVTYHIRRLAIGPDRALEGSSQVLALLPGLTGEYLRRAFLASVVARCAPTATIGFGTLFSQTGVRIGDRAYIGPRCHIGLAHIENDVLIAAGVHIPSGARTHGTDDPTTPIREQRHRRAVVRIGAGSWIGSAAVVMADVGRNSVVGAGAVVTRPLPDNVVAAGVPARVVRQRVPVAGVGDGVEEASAP